MTTKKLIGKIHLWLGLASGLVVFLVSISGAIMVFEKEIRWATGTASYDRTVPGQKAPAAPPSLIFQKSLEVAPQGGTYQYFFTGEQENNVIVNWHYHPGSEEADIPAGYREIHQNPYTGKVLLNELWEGGFWGWMVKFHTTLLLPYEVGHQVVGWATVIFILMLITGLVLWFPKSRKGYKQRFSVKWGASFKRVNYDLHNVLGFYTLWVVIIIALTGLVWSFGWFSNGVYFMATGEKQPEYQGALSTYHSEDAPQTDDQLFTLIDQVTATTLNQYPEVYRYSVSYPMDSTASIAVSILTEQGKNYDRHDEYVYDRYTGELIASEKWSEHNAGERIMHLNYPIHLGLIGGLPTKILAFFASLIAASLPITGFYIWWGRKKKTKKRRRDKKAFRQIEIAGQ
ncbi:PepSY-associated TM helix domain-containing protein [Tunicatimonas pelagia]|uniref:PepSY-associated TM helix domain-containing protein n=1 Tax=Tunicatimonas pelagia TaxID=931531 RepID=UPI00266575EA|nr:PepSY-associated TM helix domain-containing protein [Tunicatimonas pelagia]WKN43003.1 PepSY-associated TM helix domain-containing protein [Tunicatimonas pelagia]